MPLTLSIIVPAYKTVKTIVRCLDSIFDQLDGYREEVEVLVVNDASPDDMTDVLREYQVRHSALRVITHETNRREAGAHNTGMENTTGEYFLRLDSDDALRPGALATLMPILRRYHPDVLLHGYARVDENGRELSVQRYSREGLFRVDTQDETEKGIVFKEVAFGLMTGNSVYRRTVAAQVRHDLAYPISGDRHFGWEVFRNCQTCYLTNAIMEDYYQYSDSVSKVLSDAAVSGLLRLDEVFWTEFHQHPRFHDCALYGFRRLFPALLGWHYLIVFDAKTGNGNCAGLYFAVLRCFVEDRTVRREMGLSGVVLRYIARHESVAFMKAYHYLDAKFFSRISARLTSLKQCRAK